MRGRWYACHSYKDGTGRKAPVRRLYLHQAILGKQTGMDIDHEDGNGLNNRRSNLRHATKRQNQQNQKRAYGVSRFKGVYKGKQPGSWKAHLRVNGKMTHIGTFYDEVEAAKAYDESARFHFGEFAGCNFHLDGELAMAA
jgi:hypothetical protein